jgi:hypothetical protein
LSYYYSQQQQERERGPGSHKAITGAANNGSGLIRITAIAHGFVTSNVVDITGVLGCTEANRTGWVITKITNDTFDLQSSTFSNAYTSGGLARLQ